MSLLFRIIYAAHANGTHHKLALDALRRLEHPQAEGWQRLFLKHAGLYLEGSKDPDNKFKDFKNHVLHVRDNYWGGAPEKVQNWYQHVVSALAAQNWSEAVYAAGVLSHYYTDPIHPFHTGQTEAENNIHRAVEWSINRSYDALWRLSEDTLPAVQVAVPEGAEWLREMTLAGAEFSNRYYEKLIAHYDITRGVSDPPAGLDAVGRTLVAELLGYAAAGFARILARALAESGQAPPEVSLTVETVVAGLQIPIKTLQKRLANGEERALVQRMYDELKATGTVDKTLPEDDRVVRDLHAAEVIAPQGKAAEAARQERLVAVAKARPARQRLATTVSAPPAPAGAEAPASASAAEDRGNVVEIPRASAIAALEAEIMEALPPVAAVAPPIPPDVGEDDADASTAEVPSDAAAPGTAQDSDAVLPAMAVQASEQLPRTLAVVRERKIYLSASDDIERAPSIGAKTAQRLAGVGVQTVADFLEEDVEQLSTMLGRRALTSRVLKDWQDQARLVMDVPGLRGTHAQLLVGAGYRDATALAAAEIDTLCAAIARFALTTEGKSILRDGDAPDIEKIKTWVDSASQALAA
jgi:predicted flap endonuclease-1-like 5' DNA nuclease